VFLHPQWGTEATEERSSVADRRKDLERRPRLSEHLLAGFSKLYLHHTGTRLTWKIRVTGKEDLFLSSFCFFVKPCFGSPHSRREEENEKVWLESMMALEDFIEQMEEFLENFLEIMLEVEEEM
jgi:hypothetical protein